MSKIITKPSLLDAITPVVILITMLAGTVYVFGLDSFGPNQVALIMAAAVAAMIGIKNGHSWKEIEQGMIDTSVSTGWPSNSGAMHHRRVFSNDCLFFFAV